MKSGWVGLLANPPAPFVHISGVKYLYLLVLAGQELPMTSYLIRRIIQMVIVTFLVAVATYWLFSISPGGPLNGIRQQQRRITAARLLRGCVPNMNLTSIGRSVLAAG